MLLRSCSSGFVYRHWALTRRPSKFQNSTFQKRIGRLLSGVAIAAPSLLLSVGCSNGGNTNGGGGGGGGGGGSVGPTVTTIKVGASPQAIAVNTSTNKIYVTGSPNGPSQPGTVWVINGANNTVKTTLTTGNNPLALAVDEPDSMVYVGNGDQTYTIINGSTDFVEVTPNPPLNGNMESNGMIYVPEFAMYLAINSQTGVNLIRPLDAASFVATGAHPGGIGADTSNEMVYVANSLGSDPNGSSSGTLSAVDPFDGVSKVVVTFPTCNPAGSYPGVFRANGVAVNSTTNMIYLSCGDNIAVVNGQTNAFTLIPSFGAPLPIAVNETTNMIYAANEAASTVTVINGTTNATTTVDTGEMPVSIAVNEQTNKIYVANANGANVTEIDGTTNATSTIPVGFGPGSIAVNPVTNVVYVVNGNDGTVSAIQE
jgi:YVTN family beta-propeller protein